MNMNENQNLNPIPPQGGPNPGPVVPETNGVGNAVNVAPPPVPPVAPAAPNPAPVTPIAPAPVEPAGPVSPVAAPAAPMNLQPEGTVVPTVEAPKPTTPEPLMGTSLNEQTVLNPSAAPDPMNPAGPQVAPGAPTPPPMGPAPNLGMMGGIPTPPSMPAEPEKKPKKNNTPLLIILVVVLIAAVGFGVYYFLFMGKTKATPITITPILKEAELGDEIPQEPLYYVTVAGTNLANCTIDSNLDTTKTGTYQFSATCGNKSLTNQTVVVKDTTAPEVSLVDVLVTPGTDVKVEDFIEEVTDFSNYTAEISEDSDYDTSVEGEYTVTIVVTDDYGNVTEEEGVLVVDENAPQSYLACEEPFESENFENATVTVTYQYGIDMFGEFYNANKSITYTFKDEDEYFEAVDTIEENTFDGNSGRITKDDRKHTIIVRDNLTQEDLASEYNVNPFPTLDTEIEQFYTDNGGECTVGFYD